MTEYKDMTKEERLKYLAGGNVTIDMISQEGETDLKEYYIFKIRGKVFKALNGQYKFDTPGEARMHGKELHLEFKAGAKETNLKNLLM